MNRIIVVCGPTGIGKTSFAIRLAKQFDAEIVGADSMQIYKYMDIGTAKPSSEELSQVPHHLVDFLEPDKDFDAGRYVSLADQAIKEISARGKNIIVAGGTGFYIKALLHGLFRTSGVCRDTIEALTRELEEKGCKYLHERLVLCDPAAARKIHPNDSFRVIRALEVFETTGKKISDHQDFHNFSTKRYEFLKIGLYMDRQELYSRINKRVEMMLDQGLLKEVATLIEKGFPLTLKSMQSIGYRHMGMFIENRVDWQEAVRLLKRDTRRYAKRQFTWFRRDDQIHWLLPSQIPVAQELIKNFLDNDT
jgi:tRNA dimethylallyltransferase